MSAESKRQSELIERLKALGLKPVTRWLPDTSDPVYMEQYRQERAKIVAAAKSDEIEWWERLQSHEGWV